jgi:hypothetical protein
MRASVVDFARASGATSPAAFAIIFSALFGLSSPTSGGVGAKDIPATSARREISFIWTRLARATSLSV